MTSEMTNMRIAVGTLLLAGLPLCGPAAGAATPYATETRRVVMIEDRGWDTAVSPDDSLDLSVLPKLEWNKKGADVSTVRGPYRFMQQAVDLSTRTFRVKGPYVKWFRKRVAVPTGLRADHAAFFRLAKARFGFTLFVNGRHAGTSYQANCEKELDVTPFLRDGENELVFGLTTFEGMYDPVRNLVRAPFYAYGEGMRWEGPVRLEFRPTTFIDDVFVETFLSTREVVFHLTLKNAAARETRVVPQVRVSPEDDYYRPHLEIAGEAVTVPAGGEVEVSYRRTWPADRKLLLWSGPNEGMQWLYLARCSLLDAKGRLVDQKDQTYGFRTVEARGRDIFVNGERVFLARTSIMGCQNDFEHWDYNRWIRGKNSVNAMRFHLGSQAFWDVPCGPRLGRYQVPELGNMFFFPESNPIDPDSIDAFCKSRCRWWRNNPSVIMYSLANETVWHSLDPKWDAFCSRYLAAMRKYAPNALMSADADNTWNGKLDVNNVHYPEGDAGTLSRKYPNAGFQFPNDLKWVDPVNGAPNGGWRTNPFAWDRPCVIGEFYCFPTPGFAGERLFDPGLHEIEDPAGSKGIDYPSPLARNPGEEALRMMCTWYRVCGFAGLNPWVRSLDYAVEPTLLDPLEFRPNWPAGGEFSRQVAMVNDGGCPVGSVKWSLDGVDCDFHAGGLIVTNVFQGSNWVGTIRARLPESARPFKLKLKAVACMGKGGPEQARLQETISVWPTAYDLSRTVDAGTVGVAGTSADGLLARLGLSSAVRVTDSLPASVTTLVVAPEAFRPAHRKMLDDLFARGGTAIVMHQKEWLPHRPDLPQADLQHAATKAFVRAKGHPLLEGVEEEHLWCWGTDNVLSAETYLKPHEGDFLPILECGGARELKWSPLLETRAGKGRAILNSFPSSALDDPIVLKLMANAIRYAARTENGARRPLAVALGTNTAARAFLARAFVKTTGNVSDADVLLVDASAGGTARKATASLLKKGGTVWLHGANPEFVRAALGEKIGGRLAFSENRPGVLFAPKAPGADTGLLRGVSNEDLAWCLAPLPGEKWSSPGEANYWRAAVKTAEPPRRQVEAADSMRMFGRFRKLTNPGFLAELKVGRGRVLVDCLDWERAVEKEPEKALRTVALLARNLGCAFDPVVKKKYSYRKLDLAKACNMGYWDQVAGDGKGGWTDQGRNDMRTFLVNHVGRNDYEETGMVTPVPPFPCQQTFNGVPFYLVDPKKNGGKGVISLGSSIAPKLMTAARDIPVGARFERLHVVHAAAWLSRPYGTPVAKFVLRYADGTEVEIPVKAVEDVCDWQKYQGGPNCKVAWSGANKVTGVSVNQSVFANPHPEKAVETLDVVGALTEAQYVVLGLTLATERKPLGEQSPELLFKADFAKEKFFSDFFGESYYNDASSAQPGADGLAVKTGKIAGLADKVKGFMRHPFEIRFSFTQTGAYARQGSVLAFAGTGVGLEIVNGAFVCLGRRLHARPVVGKRRACVIRYDGQSVWAWLDGGLEFVADAEGFSFMDSDSSHVALGWSQMPVTVHELSCFALKESK